VATLIRKEKDIKSAAAQLGHASEEVTDTYYIAKPILAPDVSDILEQLGADQRPSDGAGGQAGVAPKAGRLASHLTIESTVRTGVEDVQSAGCGDSTGSRLTKLS
jgi:hypothetical protein